MQSNSLGQSAQQAKIASKRFALILTCFLTALALIAFAGNSILCRYALAETTIDPSTFTLIRVISGAAILGIVMGSRRRCASLEGDWWSAAALFVYAAAFSWAYVNLPAATGALLLFGAVQITMVTKGLLAGERLRPVQWLGFIAACGGLVYLLLPNVNPAPIAASLLMVCAGVAWGAYSLFGRGARDAAGTTAGNFVRASALAVAFSTLMMQSFHFEWKGAGYALISGAVTSGLGYMVWYRALRNLSATTAATVQLSVPIVAALGAIVFLGEHISGRFVLSSFVVVVGIGMVTIWSRPGKTV